MTAFNKEVPSELSYQAGLATFAPYAVKYGPTFYNWDQMDDAIMSIDEDIDVFGRKTDMADGFMELTPMLSPVPKKAAVVLISDGESNIGGSPVDAARSLYNANPGQVCIHVVSLSDSAGGQNTLDAIAGLNPCSVSASAPELLADSAAMQQFVKDVLYIDREVVVAPKPAPKPAPVPEPVFEEVITFRSVTFDFDSANIKDEMAPILEQAAIIISERTGQIIVVEGHTDSTGSDDYNQGLSERRAVSVKEFLAANGVPAGNIETIGYGESRPKFDNTNSEGRALNRRVEIRFK
jgi:OOP family OmpA-OmpF porin